MRMLVVGEVVSSKVGLTLYDIGVGRNGTESEWSSANHGLALGCEAC